jgi:hypothetical protein
MKHIGLAISVILILSLLVVAPAFSQVVRNVTFSSVGDSGVSGTATTIVGAVGGDRPYQNVELNIRLNETPPADMVYEAWLVDNEANVRRSMGIFTGTRFTGRQQFANFTASGPYDTIAISTEPMRDTSPLPFTVVALGNLPGTTVAAADFTTAAVMPEDEAFQRQIIAQRYNLTSDQVTNLRMQGWSYDDISLAANVSARCNRPLSQVAQMMQQGYTLDQIASECNTTTALLLTPTPMQAVAGSIEVVPGMRTYYRTYPNGAPVLTQQMWSDLSKQGYSWRDVAIATNIAASTGEQIPDLLRMVRIQGMTWRQIAIQRGLNADKMLDVSMWPFSRNGNMPDMGTTTPSEQQMETMPQTGSGY